MNASRSLGRTCGVEDCGRDWFSAGLCQMHYTRKLRTGTTDVRPAPSRRDDVDRFLSKISIAGPNECWLWTGAVVAHYGQFYVQSRKVLAHRFAHELWVGLIPQGYEVDHVYARGCRSTLCVNPAHLEAVTPEENAIRQVVSPAAINRAKTSCKRGHPLEEPNLRIELGRTGKPRRVCIACNRESQRQRRSVAK
jgi:hypothetical protein